jgi:hypothetical protein
LSSNSTSFTMPVESSNGQVGLSSQDPFGNIYVGSLKGSAVAVPVFKYASGATSVHSSSVYNAVAVAYNRFFNLAYVANPTSVYIAFPGGDSEVLSNFTSIQGITLSIPSGSAYVLDRGTGADGTLTQLALTY